MGPPHGCAPAWSPTVSSCAIQSYMQLLQLQSLSRVQQQARSCAGCATTSCQQLASDSVTHFKEKQPLLRQAERGGRGQQGVLVSRSDLVKAQKAGVVNRKHTSMGVKVKAGRDSWTHSYNCTHRQRGH